MEKSGRLYSLVCFSIIMLIMVPLVHSQELPPRPMKVTTFQDMNFGAFINGTSGGTVTINPEGSRLATGDIWLLNSGTGFYPAIFEIEALPGNIIHVYLPVFTSLTGPSGKITQLKIDSSLPVSPFVNTVDPPFRSQVRIGGTLTIEGSLQTPPGNYYGTFTITFMQE